MLPKIDYPTFTITIPSTKKEINFRRFLVKEEKILLMAQTSGSEKEIIQAIRQIISNCALDELDIDRLSIFDMEYIFIQLTAKSVNNIVTLHFEDTEDHKEYEFKVNLEEVSVIEDPKHSTKVKLTDEITMEMKYPSVAIIDNITDEDSAAEILEKSLLASVERIYTKDEVFDTFSKEELQEFLDSLSTQEYSKIEEFFTTMPKIYHKIDYTNSLGHNRKIELRELKDFFTFV